MSVRSLRIASSDHNPLLPLFLLSLVATLFVGCQDPPAPGAPPLADPAAPHAAGEVADGAGRTGAPAPPTEPKRATTETAWEKLGEWSGKQSVQTESFTGLTGAFRIKWQSKGPADGKFLLTIHSSISGRPLGVAVDQQGPGADTAYVNEDPRVFFAVIETDRMEWWFSVEEAMGTRSVP